MSDIVMPRLSDSMEEGTVLKWLVSEGDEVKRGQALAEIETDKANMTYESPEDGVVEELIAAEGDTLPVGEVIARLGSDRDGAVSASPAPGEMNTNSLAGDTDPSPSRAGSEPTRSEPSEPASATAQSEPPLPLEEKGKAGGTERVKASPVAKRMASELGVELARLEGSGPGGRIVKADVQAAVDEHPAPAEEPAREAGVKGQVQVVEPTRIQQTVARRMAESKATAPDFELEIVVDMSTCVELRERLGTMVREPEEVAPTYNDMVVKACAHALRESPRVNAAYRDGRFELYSRVNVGIAVAAQDALVVPTIFDADEKSLGQIARESRMLSARVREGSITPPEVTGGTFTVSNLGMYGIDRFTAIVNPPQAAVLAVGSIAKRPAVDERGRVLARETMIATLACDHRILYGAEGAEFLARVRELLEDPLSLTL